MSFSSSHFFLLLFLSFSLEKTLPSSKGKLQPCSQDGEFKSGVQPRGFTSVEVTRTPGRGREGTCAHERSLVDWVFPVCPQGR